jgi:hypothetical protein
LKLFLDVLAKGENGRVSSDGGSRATRSDLNRDSNSRRGNQLQRDALRQLGSPRRNRRGEDLNAPLPSGSARLDSGNVVRSRRDANSRSRRRPTRR